MAWLHTWVGLLVGWILYFIFLTGTLGYFDAEIDRWMRPELSLSSGPGAATDMAELGLARLQATAPDATRWVVHLPNRNADTGLRVSWLVPAAEGESADSKTEILDPDHGRPVEVRQTGGGQLLYQMHYRLHYLNSQDAYWIVGFCTMFMLVAIVSGVIVHKKIFKDFFTFRPGKGQRSWLDAHNVLSVVALPFHIMITYSGLIFFMFTYMPLVLSEVYGFDQKTQDAFFDEAYPGVPDIPRSGVAAPLTDIRPLLARFEREGMSRVLSINVRNPGDANARIILVRERDNPQTGSDQAIYNGVTGELVDPTGPARFAARKVNDVMIGLHEGLFAGPLLRWLYFLSGLLGTTMIATGLVLWTVKRRGKEAAGEKVTGLALVERLNVGTIAGLPIGIAAYFWANRLLPVGMVMRGSREAHAMFCVWALVLLYAAIRPVGRAWIELFALAGVLYLLIPFVNALTTDRHLGVTVPYDHWQGDWGLAGFDLTALAFGVVFGMIARTLWKNAALRVPSKTSSSHPASLHFPAGAIE